MDKTKIEMNKTEIEMDKTKIEMDKTEIEKDKTEIELSHKWALLTWNCSFFGIFLPCLTQCAL